MTTWWIVLAAVAVVVVGILVLRLHAFLTLLAAGFLVAVFSSGGEMKSRYAADQLAGGRWSADQADAFESASAASRLAAAVGDMTGKIGILIALAAVIGALMARSGAAAKIVDAMLARIGPRRAPEALAASSFVLGIPVFFDTVFYLMIPIARSAFARTGKNYVLLVLSILAGGSLAHSLVPPTPGPLTIAETLEIEIASMMAAGMWVAFLGGAAALMVARWIDRRVVVPVRPLEGLDGESSAPQATEAAAVNPSQESHPELPPLLLSGLPIVLPVTLLIGGSLLRVGDSPDLPDWITAWTDKNLALAAGAIACLPLLKYIAAGNRAEVVSGAIRSAGGIILITAAGGALGEMLRQAGVGPAVAAVSATASGLWVLPLAFLITAAIRTLQGSATVAMITAAGVLQGLANVESLGFDPVYLAMAIGAGSKPVSWMTDSAFWVITRMSGMTEAEGLKTLAPMSTAMGVAALLITLATAWLLPDFPV